MLFEDRFQAGRELASKLAEFRNRDDTVVLALPRGGVPVGYEVAKAIHAPLDIFVVRKLGVPGQEELAMGALASGGITVLNRDVVEGLAISPETIKAASSREERELERREREYRDGRPAANIQGRTVILVDDGLATGASMRVAAAALRKKFPAQIVVAVPVASPATCEEFEAEVDRVICAVTRSPFWQWGYGIGTFLRRQTKKFASYCAALLILFTESRMTEWIGVLRADQSVTASSYTRELARDHGRARRLSTAHGRVRGGWQSDSHACSISAGLEIETTIS